MDRLMLLTFDEPPGNIKAGWKENHNEFAAKLKNLTAHGVTDIGPALKSSFDMLNMNRNQSGIDTYGQGRCPFYTEPALIICFTDGHSMVSSNGIQKQLTLPMSNGLAGSELTKEPFRWDQRVFSVVLKLPAVEIPEPQTDNSFIPSADSSPINLMCDVTGGRSYLVSSPRQLNQTLESLAQKSAMHGVVVNFEYIESPFSTADDSIRPSSPNQPTANSWKSTKRMIFVKTSAQRGHSVGHWPLPESYWPDAKAKNLAARDAQPYIKFSSPVAPPAAHQMSNCAIDMYELEPSPLTQHILKNKSSHCYQTFISQSSKYGEHPFGFIQANHASQKVVLHIMPYNYPVFLSLLDELQKNSMKTSPKWKSEFDNYLRTMPGYYAPHLRRALGRMGVHGVVPDSLDSCLSFAVVTHLKQVRIKAKQEYESLITSVGQIAPPTEFIQVTNKNASSLLARQDFNELLKYTGGDYSSLASLQKELIKYESFPIATPCPNPSSINTFNYKNPYDIKRNDLLSQIGKLRASLLNPHSEAGLLLKHEHLHHLPMAKMGNYHEYLEKAPKPLRKIDTQPERVHTFGNPFKVNKNLMIDEADEAMPGLTPSGGSSPKRSKREANDSPVPGGPPKKKKKPGPLPRHITLTNRPTTPPIPPASPSPPVSPAVLTNGDEPELIDITNNRTTKSVSDTDHTAHIKQIIQGKDVNGIITTAKYNGISSKVNNSRSGNTFNAKIVQQQNHRTSSQVLLPSESTETTKFDVAEKFNEHLFKSVLVKEIKRPGKNYKELFDPLDSLQGTVEQKHQVVDRLVYESFRFKRKQLADKLLQYKHDHMVSKSTTAAQANGSSSILPSSEQVTMSHNSGKPIQSAVIDNDKISRLQQSEKT